MNDMSLRMVSAQPETARDWVGVLAQYRDPDTSRSIFELAVTLVPFFMLWGLAIWSLSVSWWLAFGIAVVNAGFLLRLFVIQHDCGHGSFFRDRKWNDRVGRVLGVLTVTPYAVWRQGHSLHHSGSGNLDRRGIGDIHTKTVAEYNAMSAWSQFGYRVYRHPLTVFGLIPGYVFLLQNRLPAGFMGAGRKYWISAMGTNVSMLLIAAVLVYFIGLWAFLMIFLTTTMLAATTGVWLFYVQHQFEATHWDQGPDWNMHDAALHGSSHYDLPPVLRWLSGNIGVHHVHHLNSRVPFYRLPEILQDYPDLGDIGRMSIRESLNSVSLRLWDEDSRRLVSFAGVRASA
jgi:omega-6 fatty acid desaturase (delta-12 desaturase)